MEAAGAVTEQGSNDPGSTGQGSAGVRDPITGLKHDFSLVLGGPLYQLYRRSHLAGALLEYPYRRTIVVTVIAWLPLLLLSIGNRAGGHTEQVSFLRDAEVQARFLVALPVLIFSEVLVHSRLTAVVQRFVQRRIVTAEELPAFDRAIRLAVRLRGSAMAEVVLLVLVYTMGLLLWGSRVLLASATWYASPAGRWQLTAAGYWYVFVSIPILQFVLLRWYWRLCIWLLFLWRVSKLNLHLVPTHPDRCAGLGFLGRAYFAYGPLLFAQGAMVAGVIASRVLYHGEKLASFRMMILGFVVLFVFLALCSMLMFSEKLADAKRRGLAEFGQISQDYVDEFEGKWAKRAGKEDDELLGSADLQSLADLGNCYSTVSGMRVLPVKPHDVARLAVVTAAPFAPLLLTAFSFEDLVVRVAKALI